MRPPGLSQPPGGLCFYLLLREAATATGSAAAVASLPLSLPEPEDELPPDEDAAVLRDKRIVHHHFASRISGVEGHSRVGKKNMSVLLEVIDIGLIPDRSSPGIAAYRTGTLRSITGSQNGHELRGQAFQLFQRHRATLG